MIYKEKLKNIKAFVFDIDGVFTDGTILLLPDGMCRTMNVQDGYAIVRALKEGFKIAIITGGNDPMVKKRMEYLGITDYYANTDDKMVAYEDFKKKYQLHNKNILSMGDDLPDIPLLENAAIGTCPVNAVHQVKAIADYISTIKGGDGAVREIVEQVLTVQDKWKNDYTKSR